VDPSGVSLFTAGLAFTDLMLTNNWCKVGGANIFFGLKLALSMSNTILCIHVSSPGKACQINSTDSSADRKHVPASFSLYMHLRHAGRRRDA